MSRFCLKSGAGHLYIVDAIIPVSLEKESKITDFRILGASFVGVDIDKTIRFLYKCIKSAQNDITAYAGYYMSSKLKKYIN